jgi:hypothetical protein
MYRLKGSGLFDQSIIQRERRTLSGECFVASWYARISRTSAPALMSGYRVTAMSATIGRASRSKSAYETLMVTVCEPAWNTIRSFRPSDWST